MVKYLVIVEKASGNYSAYSPDVPGCVSASDTVNETLAHFREALKMHIEGLIEDGDPMPVPASVTAEFVEAPVQQTVS